MDANERSCRRIKVLDLKVRINNLHTDKDKIYYVLKNVDDDFLWWFISLKNEPTTWESFKDLLKEKYIVEEQIIDDKKEQLKKETEYVDKIEENVMKRLKAMPKTDFRCFKCNELGHYANSCTNLPKLD